MQYQFPVPTPCFNISNTLLFVRRLSYRWLDFSPLDVFLKLLTNGRASVGYLVSFVKKQNDRWLFASCLLPSGSKD